MPTTAIDEAKINKTVDDILHICETNGLSYQEVQIALQRAMMAVQTGVSELLSEPYVAPEHPVFENTK